jgi:hypothetical protein
MDTAAGAAFCALATAANITTANVEMIALFANDLDVI